MAGNVSPESANLFACVCVFVRMLDPITAGSVSSDLNELKCDPEDASQGWKCSSSRAMGLKK